MGYPDDPVVVKPKQDTKIYQAEELNISSTRSKQVVNRYSDLNRTLYIILHALINISTKRYFGIRTLVEVLRGSKNKKVINNELDQVLEYGALKEYTYDEIKIMIEWLIEKGFILRTKEKYPVLHITAKGIRYGEEIKPAMMKELQQRLEVKKE